MRRALYIALIALLIIIGMWIVADAAQADTTPTTMDFLERYLGSQDSPLPAYTIYWFWRAHPDFDIAGYLTVMAAESSLGTTGGSRRYNNPGNLKPSQASNPWQQLASGTWYSKGQGTYNRYPDMYTGQRAAILLIYARYNSALAGHNWSGFARRYYGEGVSGLGSYTSNLAVLHSRILRDAARYGLVWE